MKQLEIQLGDITTDGKAAVIAVTDPLVRAPFPGNMIPAARVDPNGRGILNVLPLPNMTNLAVTKGAYNYQY